MWAVQCSLAELNNGFHGPQMTLMYQTCTRLVVRAPLYRPNRNLSPAPEHLCLKCTQTVRRQVSKWAACALSEVAHFFGSAQLFGPAVVLVEPALVCAGPYVQPEQGAHLWPWLHLAIGLSIHKPYVQPARRLRRYQRT